MNIDADNDEMQRYVCVFENKCKFFCACALKHVKKCTTAISKIKFIQTAVR